MDKGEEMNWASYTILVMEFIALCIAAANHGENKGKHNFFIAICSVILTIALLYFAGFFN